MPATAPAPGFNTCAKLFGLIPKLASVVGVTTGFGFEYPRPLVIAGAATAGAAGVLGTDVGLGTRGKFRPSAATAVCALIRWEGRIAIGMGLGSEASAPGVPGAAGTGESCGKLRLIDGATVLATAAPIGAPPPIAVPILDAIPLGCATGAGGGPSPAYEGAPTGNVLDEPTP
jgi:hypothetical protein